MICFFSAFRFHGDRWIQRVNSVQKKEKLQRILGTVIVWNNPMQYGMPSDLATTVDGLCQHFLKAYKSVHTVFNLIVQRLHNWPV